MNYEIDDIGRCEVCGHYVPEVELTEVTKILMCPECFPTEE